MFVGLSGCLLLASCSNVRLQTADELSGNIYKGTQEQERADCMKLSSPMEVGDCLRRRQISYDDYKKERSRN